MEERYTIRIYDENLVQRINEVYKKCRSLYSTLNPFLVECLKEGIETLNSNLFDNEQPLNITTIFNQNNEIQESLKQLNNDKNLKNKMTYANIVINQKLLACIYNIVLGLSENLPKEKKYIDDGLYDELPIRLIDLLDKLSN